MFEYAKNGQWEKISPIKNDPILAEAIKLKEFALIEPILEKNYDLAMRRAALGKYLTLAELLLPHLKNVHTCSTKANNKTLLHFVAQNGWNDILLKLITKHNAYPNMLDDDNRSPIYYALENKHIDTCILLLERDAYLPIKEIFPPQIGGESISFSYHPANKDLAKKYVSMMESCLRDPLKKTEMEDFLKHLSVVCKKKNVLPSIVNNPQNSWVMNSTELSVPLEAVDKTYEFFDAAELPYLTVNEFIKVDKIHCEKANDIISDMLKKRKGAEEIITVDKNKYDEISRSINFRVLVQHALYIEKILGCFFELVLTNKYNYILKSKTTTLLTEKQIKIAHTCQKFCKCENDQISISRDHLLNFVRELLLFTEPSLKTKIKLLHDIMGCEFEIHMLNDQNYTLATKELPFTQAGLAITNHCMKFSTIDNRGNIYIEKSQIDGFIKLALDIVQQVNISNVPSTYRPAFS